VNLCMIAALALDNTDNYAPLIIGTIGIPFAGALGAFAAGMFE
jgi:hypothetical protein